MAGKGRKRFDKKHRLLRTGEVTGLRWYDIDLQEGMITVNHTLVYYNHAKNGCYFNIHTPKTESGKRKIPMLDYNRFGNTQHQGTLNKALKRIIRDCNDEQFRKSIANSVLLTKFSCHSLRHTFTTRLVEEGVNIRVIQDVLGHKDIETTLNIYADVTKELKQKEFSMLREKMNKKL